MKTELLNSFLNEEADDHVRELLLRQISDCRSGKTVGSRKFDFNRFAVTLNCETRQILLEDDLDAEKSGEGVWPMEEFESALTSRAK